MTIRYRDATPDDAEALDRIFRTSFSDTFAHLYRPEDLAAFMASFDVSSWKSALVDPAFAFRIADMDGEPVGYLKLGPMKLPFETDQPALLLDQLYLLRPAHGSGIAQQLMDWGLTEAQRRGAKEMYLSVYVDNHRARRFYDRYGFVVVGRYDFIVGDHADEDVIMRKAL